MDVFISKLKMKADEANGLPRRGSDAHADVKQFPDFFQKVKTTVIQTFVLCGPVKIFNEPLMKIK